MSIFGNTLSFGSIDSDEHAALSKRSEVWVIVGVAGRQAAAEPCAPTAARLPSVTLHDPFS